jgi:site-specific DNA-methyltransferase (adenine-specific)
VATEGKRRLPTQYRLVIIRGNDSGAPVTNQLFYGDNLGVLRESIADQSVDLIYLDPPFNSNANYNILFKSPTGGGAEAQVEAFEDTWHWGEQAALAYDEVLRSRNTDAAQLLKAMRDFLGENDMMAYLAMMAVRLLELHRVLKPTGSLYLHCDPVASHYLKLLLDGIFQPTNFRNEIIWKRTTPKGHAFTRFPSSHDVIFFYANGPVSTWHAHHVPHRQEYVDSHYRSVEPSTGRRFMLDNCLNPNPDRPNLTYEWNGHLRVWRWTKEKMQDLDNQGRLVYTKSGMPRYKRYLDEMPGSAVTSIWVDIPPINSQAQERLGYPTQKPLALLERIILSSSNEGDVVLDPFCGCGTAVHAAEKLHRRWIGIDVTCLAIGLIERRLKDAFPGIAFEVHGTPKTLQDALDLAARDKYQFQWWAVGLVGARPYGGKRKGADRGIDGIRFFQPDAKKTESILVSVKGGENVGVNMVRELHSVIEREKAPLGVLISLALPTRPMEKEAAAAGFYECDFGKFPRLQLVTLAELFQGRLPKLPPEPTGATFKTAQREDRARQHDLKL